MIIPSTFAKIANEAVKARLIQLEGKLPTQEEITAHGCMAYPPDTKFFFEWKGEAVLFFHFENGTLSALQLP